MERNEKRILIVLAILIAAALVAVVLVRGGETDVVVNEFVAPSFDETAVVGVPEGMDPTKYGTLALNETIQVSLYSTPLVEGTSAKVYFTSSESNTAWVKLRLLDVKGEVLGETGLIRPGEYVESITLVKEPREAEAVARILTYEPETYYSLGSASAQILLEL